ncbi:nitroreductase family protein [Lacisediminihabitans sp. FW035]
MSILDAVAGRRSQPKVTSDAPSHDELLPLVAAAASVADHGSLRPWRLIELRGDARARLGEAFAEASGAEGADAEKLVGKAMRASLLIAVVASFQPSPKVSDWEQEAVASGVAHTLSLLLDDAGWGVMWRTGHLTRSLPVRVLHGLRDSEQLLGWLYVGGRDAGDKAGERKPFPAEDYLSVL